MRAIVLVLALLAVAPGAAAEAREPSADDARAETKFTASPRERFTFSLWIAGAATKTPAAQEEVLRLWSRLKLHDLDLESRKISKAKAAQGDRNGATSDDFSDALAPYVAARDEVEAIVRLLTPTEDRPMANAYSLVLGPMRMRLAAVLK